MTLPTDITKHTLDGFGFCCAPPQSIECDQLVFVVIAVDSGTCSPWDRSSFASAVSMLMHGFLDALPRFEICQGNGLGKEGARLCELAVSSIEVTRGSSCLHC